MAFSTGSLLRHSAILLLSTSLSSSTPKLVTQPTLLPDHQSWALLPSCREHVWNTDYMLPFSAASHVFKKEGVNTREQPPNTWLCYGVSHPVASESIGRTGPFGVGVAFARGRRLLGSSLGFKPVEKDYGDRSYSHHLSLNGTFCCFFSPPVHNVMLQAAELWGAFFRKLYHSLQHIFDRKQNFL